MPPTDSAIADYQRETAELRGDVKMIKWVVDFNIAFSVAIVMLLVRLLPSAAI